MFILIEYIYFSSKCFSFLTFFLDSLGGSELKSQDHYLFCLSDDSACMHLVLQAMSFRSAPGVCRAPESKGDVLHMREESK